jgi:hypothetical protein
MPTYFGVSRWFASSCTDFVVADLSIIDGWLNLLQRWLVDPGTTVIIPFDFRVIFVRPLNGAEFSSRLAEVA